MTTIAPQVWRTLATAVDAGMGLEAVLASSSSSSASSSAWPGPLVQALRRGARSGHPGAALLQAGLVDDGAAALLDAGARGGFLPAALRAVADLVEEGQQRRRRLLLAVIYPVLVVCAAFVLLPLPGIVTGGIGAWARVALPGLFTVVGTMLVVFVVVPRLAPTTRQRLRGLWVGVPAIGGIVIDDARATALSVLARLLSAGMSPGLALPLSARASGLSDVAARGDDAVAVLSRGGTLVQALTMLDLLDDEGRALLMVNETTGTLDAGLAAHASRLQERSRRRFLVVAGVIAAAVGAVVAVAVGVQIVRGFLGYVDTIDAITR
jgi:general secretion pathway protein F